MSPKSTTAARAVRVCADVVRAGPVPAAVIALCLGVQSVLPAAQVLLLQNVFERLLHPAAAPAAAWPAFALYAGTVLLAAAIGTVETVAFGRLAAAVSPRTEEAFLAAARRIPLLEFEQAATADEISSARDGASHFTRGFHAVLRSLHSTVQVVGLLAALTRLSPLLAALILTAAAPRVWIQRRAARRQQDLQRAVQRDIRYAGYLIGLFGDRAAAADIRIHRLTDPLLRRWRALALRVDAAQQSLRMRLARADAAFELGYGGVLALAFAGSLWLVRDRSLTLAAWMAAIGATESSGTGLAAAISRWTGLAWDLDLIAMAAGVIRTPGPDPARTPLARGFALELDSVSFRYPGVDAAGVRDIHLRLAYGRTVALVGPNGSGKTTLAKLVLGLYTPDAGSVRPLIPGALLAGGSAVFQDFARYAFTVRDNVAVGDVTTPPDDARVWRALRIAGAEPFVRALPGGLDTQLGTMLPDGTELSGGQWQRIAIARTAVGEGPLVVLDEPTASLDPLAEAEVYAALMRAQAGRGVLLISHRLGFARHADLIVVLRDGRVAERGTHDQLLARAGDYARMWEQQAGWYR